MAIRYIVRPSGILTTPKALKIATQARALAEAESGLRNQKFNPALDVFIGLPRSARVEGLSEGQRASYHQLRLFYTSTKFQQRKALHEAGVSVPMTVGIHNLDMLADGWDNKCVKRPLHHRAGQGFEVGRFAELHPSLNVATHYLSVLFRRTHEYRVIYCHGKRIATLLKKHPDAAPLPQDRPWTHAEGAFFVGLSSPQETHRLTQRGCYEALERFHVIQEAHLCAVDVMVNDTSYAVSEINFAPALTVQSRIEAVAARLLEVRSAS